MGTSVYPGALDDFAEASPPYLADDDTTGRDHPARHDDMEAAMEAVQGELGTDPAGGSATVKARLDAADATVASKAPLDSPAFTGTVNFTGTSVIGLPVAGLSASPPSSIANSGGTASLAGNTVTFTGVSSVSLNGCFTGEYDNYRVLVHVKSATASGFIMMRLRSSGTDASTGYYSSGPLTGVNGVSSYFADDNASSFTIRAVLSTQAGGSSSIDVMAPYVSTYTTGNGNWGANSSTGTWQAGSFGWLHANPSALYDGFTIYPDSGTLNGTVSVYGYKP